MDEIRTPTRSYVIVAWVGAVVIGVLSGLGTAFLAQDPWTGVIVGAIVTVLVGASIVLAARRGGRGTIESAPPWTGEAGARNHGSGTT